MLQLIRSKTGSIVVKFILLLIVAGFAFWGVSDIFRRGPAGEAVAFVNGKKVAVVEAAQEFQRIYGMYSMLMGGEFSMQQAKDSGLADMALHQAVNKKIMHYATEDIGLSVGDDQVKSYIQTQPNYKNDKGEFDRERFKQFVQFSGVPEPVFVDNLRGEIAQKQLFDTITKVPATNTFMTNALYTYDNEKRTADVALLNFKDQKVDAPTTEEIKKHYDEYGDSKFKKPEYRGFNSINLPLSEFTTKITIADEKAKKYYDENADEFNEPKKFTVDQLIADTKEFATKARTLLESGKKLDEITKELGKENISTEALGSVADGDLTEDIADVVRKTKEGKISEPFEGDGAWFVVRVTKIDEAKNKTFEDAKKDIVEELKKEEAINEASKVSTKIEDLIGKGKKLKDIADELKLPYESFAPVDSNGLQQDGKFLKTPPQVVETAFDTDLNKISGVREGENNSHFAVEVTQIIAPELKPLDSVQKEIVKTLTTEKQEKMAKDRAEKLVADLGAHSTKQAFDAAIAKAGLTVEASKPFKRTENPKNIPASVVSTLFSTDTLDKVDTGSTGSGYAIARLSKIEKANIADAKDDMTKFKTTLTDALGQDIRAQFMESMKKKLNVQVYPDVFKRTL